MPAQSISLLFSFLLALACETVQKPVSLARCLGNGEMMGFLTFFFYKQNLAPANIFIFTMTTAAISLFFCIWCYRTGTGSHVFVVSTSLDASDAAAAHNLPHFSESSPPFFIHSIQSTLNLVKPTTDQTALC